MSDGTRIKGHMSTRDRYVGSNERGTSIEWWMENYTKKRHHAVAHDLTLQLEAEERRRTRKEKEMQRMRGGGCKYRREEVSGSESGTSHVTLIRRPARHSFPQT